MGRCFCRRDYFGNQKWRDLADKRARSGSSAPSAGCRACEVRGRRSGGARWDLRWAKGWALAKGWGLALLHPAPAPPRGGCWQGTGLGRSGGLRPKIGSWVPWVSHPMFTQAFWWLVAQLNSLSVFFPYGVKPFVPVPADFVGIQPL